MRSATASGRWASVVSTRSTPLSAGHRDGELLRVLDEPGETGPALGLALDDALDQRLGPSFQADEEGLVGAQDVQQPVQIVVRLERLDDEQQAMTGFAVQRARGLDLPAPELVAELGVGPCERLELDRRVRHVVVGQRVHERGQHGRLPHSRRAGDQDREHAA